MRITNGEIAKHEARAMRLILASLRADEDADTATQMSYTVLNEIDCAECFEYVVGVLATIAAEEMAITYGPKKAARDLEKRIAGLLDFAAS